MAPISVVTNSFRARINLYCYARPQEFLCRAEVIPMRPVRKDRLVRFALDPRNLRRNQTPVVWYRSSLACGGYATPDN